MEVLEVSNLRKTYPAFSLQDVTFSIEEGKIIGFIGRNGAGKTTTLKSILGFVHPDGGTVRFFGQEFASHQCDIKQKIGYVSGGFSFYATKKLGTITEVTKTFYQDWDDQLYKQYCEKFNLDETKTPAKLSEGMKVKYSIALALSHHARLLLLDEPTSGLDPISREELLDMFLELQDQGTTIFFSTHITSDLDKCADQILYIQKGKITHDCSLDEFTSQYLAVDLTKEQYGAVDQSLLIGCKRSKNGYSAIIPKGQEAAFAGMVQPADLETLMVHLEKENGYE